MQERNILRSKLDIIPPLYKQVQKEIKLYCQEKIGTTFAPTFANQKKDLQI